MVSDCTLAVNVGTLTVSGGTLTVNGGTLINIGGTQMSNDHHRLSSVVARTTQSRHHRAKQHPHVC
jgi:hypothetical protein